MARNFLTNINGNKNQLLNWLLQVLGSDPADTPADAGRIWFNSGDDHPKIQTADGIKNILITGDGGGGGGGDADTLEGQNGAYYRARGNHTGTQLAATISDFDTQVRTSSLNQMTAPTADLSINSHKLTNVTNPTSAQDAATKAYVDSLSSGRDWKDSVRVATTAAGTLASSFENGDTVDGVTLVTGDRILIKNQVAGAENGIYTVNASGAPTRTDDAVTGTISSGATIPVESGTTNGDKRFILTTDGTITVGTTALTFTADAGESIAAGTGLTKTGNTLAIDPAVVVSKYATNVGDGSSTSITVTHNLGTRDVTVGVYLAASTYDEVECDVLHATTNTITLVFAVAPTTNQYRCVVHG